MAEIITSRGMMDESLLVKTDGTLDNEIEYTTWQEWRAADGEVVKREVQVRLKKPAVFADGVAGTF